MKPFKLTEARRMRREPTPAEAWLWQHVRGKRLGAPFRRQVPMLGYIADFYCPSVRLVVELDGAQHRIDAGNRDHDLRRDQTFLDHGIATLRFTNQQVLRNVNAVVLEIGHQMAIARMVPA